MREAAQNATNAERDQSRTDAVAGSDVENLSGEGSIYGGLARQRDAGVAGASCFIIIAPVFHGPRRK